MRETEILERPSEGTDFKCYRMRGVDLLWFYYPEKIPVELKNQYLEYGSPSHIKRLLPEVAQTLLFNSVSVYNVGLAGSFARDEAGIFSDIDMLVFTSSRLASRFAYQTLALGDITPEVAEFKDCFDTLGVNRRRVNEVLSDGIPSDPNWEFGLIDLQLIVLPDSCELDIVRLFNRLNPLTIEGLTFMGSLGRDFLLYDPGKGEFSRPEEHWLIDLYKSEAVNFGSEA